MKKAILYVHGKGGNAQECRQYEKFCPGYDLHGVDFESFNLLDTGKIISDEFLRLNSKYEKVSLLANSIGAYFSMYSLQGCNLEKAFFISPILDFEKLILDMLKLTGATENELRERGEIVSDFGETLSWEYLCSVRKNPVHEWKIPTEILYAENDNLTSRETVDKFIFTHNANLTMMKDGEHWFHTPEQMKFLCEWLHNVTV